LSKPWMVVREYVHRAHNLVLVEVLARRRPRRVLARGLVERVSETKDVPSLMGEKCHIVGTRSAKYARTGCAHVTDIDIEESDHSCKLRPIQRERVDGAP